MPSSADKTPGFIHSPRPALRPECIARTLRTMWNLEGTLRDVGGDRDQNLILSTPQHGHYVLKIAQAGEDPGVLDLQTTALHHVSTRAPRLPVPRVVPTVAGAPAHVIEARDPENGSHVLRIFTWLPGQPVLHLGRPPALMRSIGAAVARLDHALRGLFHPRGDHTLLWDIRQAPAIRAYVESVDDDRLRARIKYILDTFIDTTLPQLSSLRAQIIHGDITGENVLIDERTRQVTGLIDFGDMIHAPLVQELAIAMADTTWELDEPWSAACALASGYDEVIPLEDEEMALVWDLARVRAALTIPILATRNAHRAEDAGSMNDLMAPCLRQLDALDTLGRERALAQFYRAIRAPEGVAVPPMTEDVAVTTRCHLLERRRHNLMPGLALFYPDDPLHVIRGEGVWLFDPAGGRHLDCYNNVPQVGHAHPHVVHAVARQSAAVSTNARYLYDSILEYAEQISARLPGKLGVAVFVNSGSEANDLAWQMARTFTGNDGALVTANAYHGGTEATAALSPCALPPDRVPVDHVARLSAPGNTREPGRRDDSTDAERAISELADRGHQLAAFMVDPTLSSDGILDPPDHYLARIAATVRGSGGICVSDEVQSGFGRLGTWWGFQARGFVPDIVTLGKPVANGYPMGVVITTPAIMSAFAEHHDYFSTFGGNPVACMAGLAVIDVIEREDLCARATNVGAFLRQGLGALASRHDCISDVRGRGMLIGVELVRDRGRRDGRSEQVDSEAGRVALLLRRSGVLVGVEGPRHNVLKIRPPLVFERHHADLLIETLDGVLGGM